MKKYRITATDQLGRKATVIIEVEEIQTVPSLVKKGLDRLSFENVGLAISIVPLVYMLIRILFAW